MRKASVMARVALPLGAVLAVLGFHTGAFGQQSPAPPPAYPYGPPPGYGTPPPPPPPPYYYYPPPPAVGVWRTFTISLGLGIGWVSMPAGPGDDRIDEDSLDYLARIGFGVSRDWVVFLGLDGASVSEEDRETTVTAYLIGAQYFLTRRFYARAGLGLATFNEDSFDPYSTTGQAFLASLGAELFQGENVALAAEWSGSLSRFSGGSYLKNGLLLVLSFY